jgi:hypothetical protein
MGIALGHIGPAALGLVTLVGMITITASTYMILYSLPLYERLAPWLAMFERLRPWREQAEAPRNDGAGAPGALVFGVGRYGRRLLEELLAAGIAVRAVDFDPELVRTLQARGLPVDFGDAEDPEALAVLALAKVRWVVSTLPTVEGNRTLRFGLKALGYTGRFAATVREPAHGLWLNQAADTLILNPFDDAAAHAAQRLATEIRATELPP